MDPLRRLFLLVLLAATSIHPLFAQWVQTNGPYCGMVLSLAVSGTSLFAGTSSGGVFLSTDNGTSWTEVNTGLTTPFVWCLAPDLSGNLFAGSDGGGVFPAITAQAGPTTTISFSLPSPSFVSLTVFDALGREVSTLVSGELPPGTHATQWNAAGLASGVYFYTLDAGSFIQTKKLLLLR